MSERGAVAAVPPTSSDRPTSSSSSSRHHQKHQKSSKSHQGGGSGSGKPERYVPGGSSSANKPPSGSKHSHSSSSKQHGGSSKHHKSSKTSASTTAATKSSSSHKASSSVVSGSAVATKAPSEVKIAGQKRKKAGEFIRDSTWQVGLPSIPVPMKMLNVPMDPNRLLKPVSLSLDLYGRIPLLPDPFHAIPGDGMDPLAHAKQRNAKVDLEDQKLLMDLSQRTSNRLNKRKGFPAEEKIPPKLPNAAPISSVGARRPSAVTRKEPQKDIENIEEFVNFINDSFVDFSDLSALPQKPNSKIRKVYPLQVIKGFKQFVNVSFDKPLSKDKSKQNAFVYHVAGSSNNSAMLYERNGGSNEADFHSLHNLKIARSGVEGQEKECFLIRDLDDNQAYLSQINFRYTMNKKQKTVTMQALMRKGLDEELARVPEGIKFTKSIRVAASKSGDQDDEEEMDE
eukprot:TRINITY_DN25607_c0_g1_i1.p1 TRINITY_DN25607_c0_g1~~TRINITY_DN25607_c0_g1_i1.p1  ORF type:complete len:454 (-),score=116.63 TRINITY_DN25607_c0_g1_i1:48-1409(-)